MFREIKDKHAGNNKRNLPFNTDEISNKYNKYKTAYKHTLIPIMKV